MWHTYPHVLSCSVGGEEGPGVRSHWMEESLDPHLMSASVSVALPAIPSLHLGQMHGERLHLGEVFLMCTLSQCY